MALDKNRTPYSPSGDRKQDEVVLSPFTYIFQHSGKEDGSEIAHAFNYWLEIPSDKLQAISGIVQILLNASFLLDDLQDNSILRRGIPVAHLIYGLAGTINAANYVTFIALERVFSLNHPEAIKIYTEEMMESFRGQGLEIYWRDNSICPSETEYKHMATSKNGGIFKLTVRLMQLFSNCRKDFTPLTKALALYFQIINDYSNLCLQENADDKSFCEDLTEGKFSFPIIHAILKHPKDKEIINILRQRTEDNAVKHYCVKLLEKFGSFAYTRAVLEDLDKKARNEVERLGGNPLLTRILDKHLSWKKQLMF